MWRSVIHRTSMEVPSDDSTDRASPEQLTQKFRRQSVRHGTLQRKESVDNHWRLFFAEKETVELPPYDSKLLEARDSIMVV